MKDLLSVEMRAGVNNEWDQSLTTLSSLKSK